MFTEKFRRVLDSVPFYDCDNLDKQGSPQQLSYGTRLNMALHKLISSDHFDRVAESRAFRSILSRQGRTNGVFEKGETALIQPCPHCGKILLF